MTRLASACVTSFVWENFRSRSFRAESVCLTLSLAGSLIAGTSGTLRAAEADLILHHGKVATVDDRFSIQEAVVVQDGRIVEVGRNEDVLKRRGTRTQLVDLRGRLVLPGLMDSHAHPADA